MADPTPPVLLDTPVPPPPPVGPPKPSFKKALADPAMIISLWVTTQFFALVVMFGFWTSQMDPEAKQVILQTYVVAFSAAWWYFLGSSAGSKAKDEQRAAAAAPK